MTEIIPDLSFSAVLEFLRDGNNIAWREDWESVFIHVKELEEYGKVIIKHETVHKTSKIDILNYIDIFAEDWKVQLIETNVTVEKVIEEDVVGIISELSLDGSVENMDVSQIDSDDILIDIDGTEIILEIDEEIEDEDIEEVLPEIHEGGPLESSPKKLCEGDCDIEEDHYDDEHPITDKDVIAPSSTEKEEEPDEDPSLHEKQDDIIDEESEDNTRRL